MAGLRHIISLGVSVSTPGRYTCGPMHARRDAAFLTRSASAQDGRAASAGRCRTSGALGASCDRRLVEPFCGGLAVALGLEPERALLNDVNPHLHQLLPLAPARADASICRWPTSGRCTIAHRVALQRPAGRGAGRDAPKRPWLFYYLNRTGYNGLCRFNRAAQFNVPFGQYAAIRYKRDFSPTGMRFAGWTFSAATSNGALRTR